MNTKSNAFNADILIIGAGPSGSVAAAILAQRGYQVTIIESSKFPRFSIGESLLPQAMEFLAQANLLRCIEDAHFQFKNGAAFSHQQHYTEFDFSQKFSIGFNSTFQVERSVFDQRLADQAAKLGTKINYEQQVTDIQLSDESQMITTMDKNGKTHQYHARFVLDASGFARVLPNLLKLNLPSEFPPRMSVFTHINSALDQKLFDQNKILITVHPTHSDIWFWLIPLSDNKYSLGVVGEPHLLQQSEDDPKKILMRLVNETPNLHQILKDINLDMPVRKIVGYAQNVSTLHGTGYALLGNAGEFLDPVFSSGVTIALKSAVLAAETLDKSLQGENVNWQQDFAIPLQKGVNTFKAYVRAWYSGELQQIIFSNTQPPEIKAKICSILAGYAWDKTNDYATDAKRKLSVLAKVCSHFQ
ncbi:NAD(P)/FAD-dependent oxidoreductase [Cysteiniphilum sp. 6C5]|uniref:NAD(P)/FAD-dependent oxidoreductase n=1 Tax=unclassified Cysteiniphilum TaxID=2610889 RepID=UPI003F83A26E